LPAGKVLHVCEFEFDFDRGGGMVRVVLPLQILLLTAMLVTCERHDMYELANFGEPPKTGLYLYYIASLKNGNLDGREGADRICYQEGYAYHKFVQATTVKAFLSVSETDEIKYIVPVYLWYYPVYALNPSLNIVQFSTSWDALWDGINSMTLLTALNLTSNWWSGSNVDGRVISGNTCDGWRSSDPLKFGQTGDPNGVALNWVGPPATLSDCGTPRFVLCLAY
jgi:hypothetical protein